MRRKPCPWIHKQDAARSRICTTTAIATDGTEGGAGTSAHARARMRPYSAVRFAKARLQLFFLVCTERAGGPAGRQWAWGQCAYREDSHAYDVGAGHFNLHRREGWRGAVAK